MSAAFSTVSQTTQRTLVSSIAGHDCYPVAYEVHKSTSYVDALWLGLAIPFGLIIGALLAIVIARCCLKRCWVRDTEEDRAALIAQHQNAPWYKRCALYCFPFLYVQQMKQQAKERPLSTPSTNSAPAAYSAGILQVNAEPIATEAGGMVDAALQETVEQAERVLQNQDIIASEGIESNTLDKRKLISEKLVQIHMNQKSEGTKADREAIEKTLSDFKARLAQTQTDLNIDYKIQLDALESDPELAQNEQKLAEAIQTAKAANRRQLHVLVKDNLNGLREIMQKDTKLSEVEITDLISKLRASLADLESHLVDVVEYQHDQLEENLGERKLLLEQIKSDGANLDKERQHLEDSIAKTLQQLCEQGKLNESAKEQLLRDLSEALKSIREKHGAAVRLQMEQIGGKLRKQRKDRLDILKKRHDDQWVALLTQADTMTDETQFLQAGRELLDQQADELAEVNVDLDKDETNKLRQAHTRVEQSWKEALQHETEQSMQKLQSQTKLSPSEIGNLLRDHEMQLREWEKMQDMERKMSVAALKTKLDERKEQMHQEATRKDSEQRRLTKQQDDMIKRVLEGQRDIDDSDRQQILAEHAHNQNVLNLMLSMSKLRQQRILDSNLAERKLILTQKQSLEKQRSERKSAKKGKADVHQDGKEENSEAILSAELEVEKMKIAEELRDSTAVETQALMKQQENNMADLIGRLQVGQARRQILLERQSQMVTKMENELKQQVKNLPAPDPNRLATLLNEHRRQVENLNKALDESRQRQLQVLREKLEEKRMKTKKNLEAKFEAEEEEILTRSLKSKMSFASSLLCQNKLTAKHQRALEQLDAQIKAELGRQKELLNKQMHKELEKALLEQKKQFLSQLASVCKMSPDDLKAITRVVQENKEDQTPPPRPERAVLPEPEAVAPTPMLLPQQVMPAYSAIGSPRSTNPNPTDGRLPPIEKMHFRQVPDNSETTAARRRRKKKNRRSHQETADDSDSV